MSEPKNRRIFWVVGSLPPWRLFLFGFRRFQWCVRSKRNCGKWSFGIEFSWTKPHLPISSHFGSTGGGLEHLRALERYEQAQQVLLDLGYFTNETFALTNPIEGRKSYAAFHQMVTNSAFLDSHWSYSTSTNRLEVTFHPPDREKWINIVEQWNTQSTGDSQQTKPN